MRYALHIFFEPPSICHSIPVYVKAIEKLPILHLDHLEPSIRYIFYGLYWIILRLDRTVFTFK